MLGPLPKQGQAGGAFMVLDRLSWTWSVVQRNHELDEKWPRTQGETNHGLTAAYTFSGSWGCPDGAAFEKWQTDEDAEL